MDGRTMREPEDVERLLGTEPEPETTPIGGAVVGGRTVEPAEPADGHVVEDGAGDETGERRDEVLVGGFMGKPSREDPLEDDDDDGSPYTLGSERR